MLKQIFAICAVLCIATARNYVMYPAVDCIGNDIHQEKTQDVDSLWYFIIILPEELMKICDSTNECIGFNTHGWLKKKCPGLQVEQSVNTYLLDTSTYL